MNEMHDGSQRAAVADPLQPENLLDGFYFLLISQLGSGGRQRGSTREKASKAFPG